MNMAPKNWIEFIKTLIGVLVIVGSTLIWAGDTRWVTQENFKLASNELSDQIAQLEINNLDSRITFLRIKIGQGEATESEKIYIQALEQQLRELKRKLDQ